jgi:hypothetical protein
MNPHISLPARCGIVTLLVALALLALVPAPAPASTGVPAAGLSATALPALDMMEIVHDRSRLIQFSIIAVAIGIGLLWWGQKW